MLWQGAHSKDGVGTAVSWQLVLRNGNILLEVAFSSTGEVPGALCVSSSHSANKPAGSYFILHVHGDGGERAEGCGRWLDYFCIFATK